MGRVYAAKEGRNGQNGEKLRFVDEKGVTVRVVVHRTTTLELQSFSF